MKQTRKLLAVLLVLALGLAGCGPQLTPYEVNNQEGFTVSVKYDANGGMFTTNTSVIVDSFNVKDVAASGAGIALLPPDAAARGNDAFKASRNGYFLAGWYREPAALIPPKLLK